MKLIVALSLALMTGSAFAQTKPYEVSGKIANLDKPATIYLTYKKSGGHTWDSTIMQNGNFAFTGKTEEPFSAVLVLDYKGIGILNMDRRSPQDVLRLYVDQGKIFVTSKDSLQSAAITGSPINADYQQYLKINRIFDTRIESIRRVTPQDTATLATLSKNKKKAQVDFIAGHSLSYIALVALEDLSRTAPGERLPEGNITIFNQLSPMLKRTTPGKAFQQRIDNQNLLAVGMPVPEFSQSTPDGTIINVSDLRGKYVLLDFWASWCGPCRAENPNLVNQYKKFEANNFTILGISLDKPGEGKAWRAAIASDQLEWPQVSDLKGWSNEVVTKFSINAIPQNFLIDPNGIIIAKNLYGKDLEQFLSKKLTPSLKP